MLDSKKTNNTVPLFRVIAGIIFAISLLQACQDSGDETISLEFGSPKKVIIGRWILTDIRKNPGAPIFVFQGWKEGTRLVFFSDGTYTDSSDGGNTSHRWKLGSDSENDPYYDGIDLGKYGFDIVSLGLGRWIMRYPKGSDDNNKPGWVIDLDKENDDPNSPIKDPEQPSVPVRYAYRVTKVEVEGWNQSQRRETNTISYGSDGKPNGISTPEGSYTWTTSGNILTLKDSRTGSKLKTCTLDSKGQYIIKEEGIGTSTNGYKATIEYDAKGYLRKWNYTANNYNGLAELKFVDEGGQALTMTEGRSTRWSRSYHFGDKNDSNIDLNPFINQMLFPEHDYLNYVLAPFDFYGQRYPLIASQIVTGADYYFDNMKVVRNEQGLISEIKISMYMPIYPDTAKELRIVVSYKEYEE